MVQFHNLKSLKPLRRKLRHGLTPAEARLWAHIQGAKLAGRKFRRQHSVGRYVLDFYCPVERLALELDGAAHDSERAQLNDETRSTFLIGLGIAILRFENRDVIENLEGVLAEIAKHFRR